MLSKLIVQTRSWSYSWTSPGAGMFVITCSADLPHLIPEISSWSVEAIGPISCADPGIFVRGGGGGPGPTANIFFLVLNLFYSFTEGVQWFISEKVIILQGFRGGPAFSMGVQLLIFIETHILLIFQGGSGPPIPRLDPHMNQLWVWTQPRCFISLLLIVKLGQFIRTYNMDRQTDWISLGMLHVL